MPYKIVKTNNCYSVVNKESGEVHSKCSTKEKAEAQLKLLYAIEKNPKFKQVKK